MYSSWRRRLWSTLRVSQGLSARRARRTKSRGPKGLQLEVGARRAPRLLVHLYSNLDKYISSGLPVKLLSLLSVFCHDIAFRTAAIQIVNRPVQITFTKCKTDFYKRLKRNSQNAETMFTRRYSDKCSCQNLSQAVDGQSKHSNLVENGIIWEGALQIVILTFSEWESSICLLWTVYHHFETTLEAKAADVRDIVAKPYQKLN